MSGLTHFNEEGKSRMVDVTDKVPTTRTAWASGRVIMNIETLRKILDKDITKGDVFEVARIAGIMAAKRTHELIPLCHPLALTVVEIDFIPDIDAGVVTIESKVGLSGKTGVEMEALTAVSVAGLTIYDMCKAIDKDIIISDIQLMKKTGGKSGTYIRNASNG